MAAAVAGVSGCWLPTAAAADQSEPDRADACYSLGKVLAHFGWTSRAIAYYQEALRIRPDFAKAHVGLADALGDRGEFAEGVAHCEKALKAEPDNERAHCVLGRLLASLERFDEALAHFRKAVELKPDDAEAHAKLGCALDQFGQFDEALAHCRRAVRIKPTSAELRLDLADALRMAGRLDEAIAECRKVLEVRPDNANAHFGLANALIQRGRADEAVAHIQKALEIEPGNPKFHNNLAVFYWVQADEAKKRGRSAEVRRLQELALDHWTQALKLQPNDPYTQANLGHLLFETSITEFDRAKREASINEAAEHCRFAIQQRPILPEPHNTLGRIYWVQGKLDEAAAEFREALKYDPRLMPARENLAKILIVQKKLGEAQEQVEAILAINTNHVGGWICQGVIHQMQGKIDDAIGAGKRRFASDPDNAPANNFLTMAYWGQGKRAEAAPCLRTVLRLAPNPAAVAEQFGEVFPSAGQEGGSGPGVDVHGLCAGHQPGRAGPQRRGGGPPGPPGDRAARWPDGGRVGRPGGRPRGERTISRRTPRAAREAAEMAEAAHDTALARQVRARIALYEKGLPFRDTWGGR